MARPRLKHRPQDGGYARGDETRELIITAAISVFADRGFDGASTRMLVEPVGASPAAIQYYFGGKAGLYRACAEYLATHAWEKIAEDAHALDDVSLDADRDVLIDILADFFLTQEKELHLEPKNAQWSLFLTRAQTFQSGEIFDIIFKGLNEPVLKKFARIVGAIVGRPQDDAETRLRTSMIIAHMTGLRSHGQITLRFMGWDEIAGDRLRMWQAVMRAHLHGMLSANVRYHAADALHITAASADPRTDDRGGTAVRARG